MSIGTLSLSGGSVSGVVRQLSATVTFEDRSNPVSMGTLPAGSHVTACYVLVREAFNDSGADTITVGESPTSTSIHSGGALNPISLGRKADDLSSIDPGDQFFYSSATEISAKSAAANEDATTGIADVVVEYITT